MLIFLVLVSFSFFSKLRENKKTAELIKTANLLFNSFEPYYMWDYVARWFEECCRYVKLFHSFYFNRIQNQTFKVPESNEKNVLLYILLLLTTINYLVAINWLCYVTLEYRIPDHINIKLKRNLENKLFSHQQR